MFRLVYTSRAFGDMSPGDISAILSEARQRNRQDGITGMLLFHKGKFLQILEGERARVQACYERIRRDGRHSNVITRFEGAVETALFSDWFLGYEALEELPALSRVSSGKALLTISQVQFRIKEIGAVATTENKQTAIAMLQRYLDLVTAKDMKAA